MTSTALYARISSDPNRDELGVRRQERECRDLADRLGWTIAEVHIDDDRSAYSGRPRPAYVAMLDAVRDGRVGAIVAWHPDRLHRSPRELEDFIDLIETSGTKVATVQAGRYDLSTPSGRMTARVVGAVARHESEHKSARLRAKHRELAEAGMPSGGGTRPFGYRSDRVSVEPCEADLVREAAGRVLAGEALRGIARDWTSRGVPTVTGTAWTTTVLSRMLQSPRIAGLRTHHGVTTTGTWEPIIDPDTHLRLVAILTDPERRMNRTAAKYLLTGGIAVCGLCRANLVSRPRGDGRRCYVCASGPGFAGCGKIRALADPLEAEVEARVLHSLAGVTLPELGDDSGGHVEAELADVEKRRARLAADHYAHGLIDRTQFAAATRALDERMATLRSRMAQQVTDARLAAVAADSDRLTASWPDLSLDQRRTVVAALVETVEVHPAVRGRNRFDPDRVRVQFRV